LSSEIGIGMMIQSSKAVTRPFRYGVIVLTESVAISIIYVERTGARKALAASPKFGESIDDFDAGVIFSD